MIVYVSTFLSPHIKPMCDYLYEITGGDFVYIETVELTAERRAMGYSYESCEVPYVTQWQENPNENKNLIDAADCVIINPCSSNFNLVKKRLSENKLTFFISERIFKRGALKILDPRVWKLALFLLGKKKKPLYLLCLGGFVAKDFYRLGFSKNKMYKFGYFPQATNSIANKHTKSKVINISWVGRMIDWKRPCFAVDVISALIKDGVECSLSMCGDGPLLESVKQYAAEKNVKDYICFGGMQKNEKVREVMAKSTVFLSTSTRMEGWGAVLNESLYAGTPVVASEEIGAAPFLIKNGYNGYTFKTNSVEEAAQAIRNIAADEERFRNGVSEICNVWNADVANHRFFRIYESIEEGNALPDIYNYGPMSKERVK